MEIVLCYDKTIVYLYLLKTVDYERNRLFVKVV